MDSFQWALEFCAVTQCTKDTVLDFYYLLKEFYIKPIGFEVKEISYNALLLYLNLDDNFYEILFCENDLLTDFKIRYDKELIRPLDICDFTPLQIVNKLVTS